MSLASAFLLNQVEDVSGDFAALKNAFSQAANLTEFDAAGMLCWKRNARKPRLVFNQFVAPYEEAKAWEFPPEYAENPETPLALSSRTGCSAPGNF